MTLKALLELFRKQKESTEFQSLLQNQKQIKVKGVQHALLKDLQILPIV